MEGVQHVHSADVYVWGCAGWFVPHGSSARGQCLCARHAAHVVQCLHCCTQGSVCVQCSCRAHSVCGARTARGHRSCGHSVHGQRVQRTWHMQQRQSRACAMHHAVQHVQCVHMCGNVQCLCSVCCVCVQCTQHKQRWCCCAVLRVCCGCLAWAVCPVQSVHAQGLRVQRVQHVCCVLHTQCVLYSQESCAHAVCASGAASPPWCPTAPCGVSVAHGALGTAQQSQGASGEPQVRAAELGAAPWGALREW